MTFVGNKFRTKMSQWLYSFDRISLKTKLVQRAQSARTLVGKCLGCKTRSLLTDNECKCSVKWGINVRKIYDKYNVNLNNNKNLGKKAHLIINASTHLLKNWIIVRAVKSKPNKLVALLKKFVKVKTKTMHVNFH